MSDRAAKNLGVSILAVIMIVLVVFVASVFPKSAYVERCAEFTPIEKADKTFTVGCYTFDAHGDYASLVSVNDNGRTEYIVTDTITYGGKTYKINEILGDAFAGCHNAKSIQLNADLEYIEDDTVWNGWEEGLVNSTNKNTIEYLSGIK